MAAMATTACAFTALAGQALLLQQPANELLRKVGTSHARVTMRKGGGGGGSGSYWYYTFLPLSPNSIRPSGCFLMQWVLPICSKKKKFDLLITLLSLLHLENCCGALDR